MIMGKKSKLTVRAQRKYAHKAYVPGTPGTSYRDAEPPELETPALSPAPPVLLKTTKKVVDLLDLMAFQNIHRHVVEQEPLKDVRVVLERIIDEDLPGSARPEPVVVLNQPTTSKPVPQKQKRKTRKWISERPITRSRAMKIIKRAHCRVSDDDNIPLKFFARNTKSEKPEAKKTGPTKALISLRKKEKIIPTIAKRTSPRQARSLSEPNLRASKRLKSREISLPKKIKEVIKEKKTTYKIKALKRKIQQHNLEDNISSKSASTSKRFRSSTSHNAPKSRPEGLPLEQTVIDCSVVIEETPMRRDDIVVKDQARASACEPAKESRDDTTQNASIQQRPSNPFADFVVQIFNDDNGLELVTEVPDSVSRVQEWLVKNNNEQSMDQSNERRSAPFKMPSTPAWRADRPRASSPISSVSTRSEAPNFTLKEMSLRNTCPTWNPKDLYDITRDKLIIRRLCGECTRCRVMFHNVSDTSSPGRKSILEFRRKAMKISMDSDHITKLKEMLTEKGKKIFRAATLVKTKIENNEPLLAREQKILAQVLAILSECNAARISEPPSEQLPEIVAVSSFPRLARPYIEDDLVSAATSSQTRLCETPDISSQRIITNSELRQSPKFTCSPEDFAQGPIKLAAKIQKDHTGVGLCGITPPSGYVPSCVVGTDEANFKISNQYIHRMLNRWGPATRELTAIRYKQDPKIQRSPLFEGLEIDLVKLFHTVQGENGIEACQNIEEKWQVVAQKMNLYCRGKPNTKLENIYLKYLLSYNTLTSEERQKANDEVQACWATREIACVRRARNPLWRQERMRSGSPTDEDERLSHLEKVCAEAEECITPGRQINYNGFVKLAQQVRGTYFPNTPHPTPEAVEREYWEIVLTANSHVCVHAASVDATEHSRGFKNEPDDTNFDTAHDPWNLKTLRNSPDNLLGYLGSSLGVSSPAIHYGMMFSTSCWHMDPTSVPWIEYLHAGTAKIWYSISADQEQKFRAAAEALCPFAVQNKAIWLPSDILMIPPNLLRQYGVSVERHVQLPGEFVVVFPNTYCACVDTGLNISEGVYYAPPNWISNIEKTFQNCRSSCEPSLFSMEKLLIEMARSERTPYYLLRRVHTVLSSILFTELSHRQDMANRNIELMSPEVFLEQNQRTSSNAWQIQPTGECAYCRCHLHLSRVVGVTEGKTSVCSSHAIFLFDTAVSRAGQMSNVYCIRLISNDEIYGIITAMKQRMMNSIQEVAL